MVFLSVAVLHRFYCNSLLTVETEFNLANSVHPGELLHWRMSINVLSGSAMLVQVCIYEILVMRH